MWSGSVEDNKKARGRLLIVELVLRLAMGGE